MYIQIFEPQPNNRMEWQNELGMVVCAPDFNPVDHTRKLINSCMQRVSKLLPFIALIPLRTPLWPNNPKISGGVTQSPVAPMNIWWKWVRWIPQGHAGWIHFTCKGCTARISLMPAAQKRRRLSQLAFRSWISSGAKTEINDNKSPGVKRQLYIVVSGWWLNVSHLCRHIL